MTELTRQAVLAHRARVQSLSAHARNPSSVGVLDIGVQDAPSGSAEHALAVRTNDPRAGDGKDLVRVLSVRSAPHLHRRRDLPALRRELRPRRPEELLGWLAGHGPALLGSGVDALAVLDHVVELLREQFPGEHATKGELSTAISPELPAPARPWCAGCQAEHVIENLFRLGTLLAGLELDRGDRRLVFRPPSEPVELAGAAGASTAPDGSLLSAFVRHAGPVRPADASTWLVAGTMSARQVPKPRGWEELLADLVPVRVDGAELLMAPDQLAEAADAPPPPAALLLPPRDPYLLGDRQLVVPDREIAKQVWRAQVSPGVLLVDGEVRGVWRQRVSGRTLYLHVTPLGKPRKGVRPAVSDQADLLAAVRGAGALHPHVLWEG